MNKLFEFTCAGCNHMIVVGISCENSTIDKIGVCPVCVQAINQKEVTSKDLDAWQTKARELLESGNLVGAIRHHREVTGAPLREAKREVEELPEWKVLKAKREARLGGDDGFTCGGIDYGRDQ